jgi:hypothetical protein
MNIFTGTNFYINAIKQRNLSQAVGFGSLSECNSLYIEDIRSLYPAGLIFYHSETCSKVGHTGLEGSSAGIHPLCL